MLVDGLLAFETLDRVRVQLLQTLLLGLLSDSVSKCRTCDDSPVLGSPASNAAMQFGPAEVGHGEDEARGAFCVSRS